MASRAEPGRVAIESGLAPAPGFRVHVETGRGPGALDVVLAVPDSPSDSLAHALRRLHDPHGSADLDARLGRLGADAPSGTAFVVMLENQAWALPSTEVTIQRTRADGTESVEAPEVLTLVPGDTVELTRAGQPEPFARMRAECRIPSPRGGPPRTGPPLAEQSPAARTVPPGSPRRVPLGRPARTAGLATLGLAALLAGWWAWRDGVAPAPTGDEDPPLGIEDRLVGLVTGAGERSDSPPPGEIGEPTSDGEVRARTSPPPESAHVARAVPSPAVGPPATAWAFRTRGPITSSPALVEDLVVFGCRDSTLYGLAAETGEARWSHAAGSGVGSSPTVIGETAFVGTYGGKLLAVDVRTGTRLWEAETGGRIVSSPCVAGGLVVVGSYDRAIHAFDPAGGDRRWRVTTGDAVRASPATVAPDGVVVGSLDGVLYCVDTGSGEVIWRADLGSRILAAAAHAAETGRIYVGTADGTAVALDAGDGRTLWRVALGATVNARPCLAGGLLLMGTGKGRLVALDPDTGETRWALEAERGFDASPLVLGEVVAVPSYDGVLHYVELADGRVRERRFLEAEVFTSPTANPDYVFLGTLGGVFHALPLP